ncbi:MAG: hypothetical protein NTZ16_14515, partial [Verrucomicrobia bacterium]|nr:hypothetical protein [Verrucomicrobiota bacterium]
MLKSAKLIFSCACATALFTGCATAQKNTDDIFTHWPAGGSPDEIGKRVAENFAARKFDFQTNPKRESVIYPE